MELKPYQKVVVADLARYLQLLVQTRSASRAYCALWEEKGVPVDSMTIRLTTNVSCAGSRRPHSCRCNVSTGSVRTPNSGISATR